MVLVISETVSTSEKLNGKNKKLNNTNSNILNTMKQSCPYTIRPESVVFYDTQSANSTAVEPRLRTGKYSFTM